MIITRKRIVLLPIFLLVLALFLAACGGQAASIATPEPTEAPAVIEQEQDEGLLLAPVLGSMRPDRCKRLKTEPK